VIFFINIICKKIENRIESDCSTIRSLKKKTPNHPASLITGEASDKCQEREEEDDLLWAMTTLGSERLYVEPLKIYMQRIRRWRERRLL
jgi:hypothetical protein